jgi:hypothetical protein
MLPNNKIQRTGQSWLIFIDKDLPAADLERSKDRKNQANAMRRFAGNSFM